MRIHIFGASGSGVTTLGKVLSEKLGFPYFDSDDYFWEKSDPPFTKKRETAARNASLQKDLQAFPHWVLGGSVINWDDTFFTQFELAVFLWLPPAVRLARLRQREWERYGNIIFLDPERNRLYNEFLQWASGYDDNSINGRTLTAHEAWIRRLSCPVLEIREDIPTEKRMEIVLHTYQQILMEG